MPSFVDLRGFIAELEKRGDLVRITAEVDPKLEMTEIADRTLRGRGPALLFENPKGAQIPVLANLFGTEERVALGMGEESVESLREVGELLAYLRQPDPPKGFRDLVDKAPLLKKILTMGPNVVKNAPCQQVSAPPERRWISTVYRFKPAGREMSLHWLPGRWLLPEVLKKSA